MQANRLESNIIKFAKEEKPVNLEFYIRQKYVSKMRWGIKHSEWESQDFSEFCPQKSNKNTNRII